MRIAVWLCVLVQLSPAVGRAQSVVPQDAVQHAGQTATVCGVVRSARYAPRTHAQPTFLNLDQPYPHQVFTVVIFGHVRSKFGSPEVAFAGKRVCDTGRIELYRGTAEMILNDPTQLRPDAGHPSGAAPLPSVLRPALSEQSWERSLRYRTILPSG
jgi:hypothetical protein